MTTKVKLFLSIVLFCFNSCTSKSQEKIAAFQNDEIVTGSQRISAYLPILKGKTIGMVVNQTSIVGRRQTHIVDTLRSLGINIKVIFAPEHGFRGKADAGEKVDNTVDVKTGIPIVSIYGKKRKPDATDLAGVDLLLFDIQDVGVRFYTYISTLQEIMEVAAEFKLPFLVLDRPNPNGHYVDGPILDKQFKSFVGMQPVPIVYGMTIGEYATMLNREGWLANGVKCNLQVIGCANYTHKSFYELPIKPSPNLPNAKSIYLYPSVCFFEGTDISCGRGTEKQFQIYGAPKYAANKKTFTFMPKPNEGAKEPYHNGKLCNGRDLSTLSIKELQDSRKVDVSYILDGYANYAPKDSFFLKGNFFEKLAGTADFRQHIKAQKSAEEIRATWTKGIETFKVIRKKYLLYTDFE
ncbi:MAG: DUF1343 domain-containing protein [Saprospiraceae bacterium]|nr:DUF1343 domain-containing protein [Saprospiraceae bacterium]